MILGYYDFATKDNIDIPNAVPDNWCGVVSDEEDFMIEYIIEFPGKDVKGYVGFSSEAGGYGDGRTFLIYKDGELDKKVFFEDLDSHELEMYFNENPMDFGIEWFICVVYEYFGKEDNFIILLYKQDPSRGSFSCPISPHCSPGTYEVMHSFPHFDPRGYNDNERLRHVEAFTHYLQCLRSNEPSISLLLKHCNKKRIKIKEKIAHS